MDYQVTLERNELVTCIRYTAKYSLKKQATEGYIQRKHHVICLRTHLYVDNTDNRNTHQTQDSVYYVYYSISFSKGKIKIRGGGTLKYNFIFFKKFFVL